MYENKHRFTKLFLNKVDWIWGSW